VLLGLKGKIPIDDRMGGKIERVPARKKKRDRARNRKPIRL